MTLCETEVLILKAIYLAGGMPTTKELSAYLPESLAKSKGISSRLCDLRKKGMAQSEMSEVGVNHWALTCNGADALLCAGTMRDTDDTPEPVVSESIQADSPDIAPGIADDSETIAATTVALSAELVSLRMSQPFDGIEPTDLPDFSPNPPACADPDPGSPDKISDALVEEANSLRLHTPFPRLKDALYTLAVLADFIGDRPAMAYELDRISDYLEGDDA